VKHEQLEELEFRLILQAIHERYGYDFREYCPETLQRRLHAARVQLGVAHLGELLHRLLREPALFAAVLSCLTIKVTEMFRDPAFYQAFRAEVLPVLRTYPQLKFWHAGCASGEEAYTMAILLAEEGLYERSLIYGTDIDSEAIEKAKEGVYSDEQASVFARNYRESGGLQELSLYLTQAYSRMAINKRLRENVSFFQHNLSSDFAFGEMNVIFCRNVALYFTEPLRERVFGLFLEGLCRGGFLCLGASESLPVKLRDRFDDYVPERRIFRARCES
jgi:chemotaxis protein methyltransferase CheR